MISYEYKQFTTISLYRHPPTINVQEPLTALITPQLSYHDHQETGLDLNTRPKKVSQSPS